MCSASAGTPQTDGPDRQHRLDRHELELDDPDVVGVGEPVMGDRADGS